MVKNENEKSLKEEIDNLKHMLHVRDLEIANLKVENKATKGASEKLNKALNEMRTKFKDEKKALLKEHRIKIKSWKKDLGQANSNLIKLRKKLEVTESNLASQSLASVHAVCSSPCTPPGWTTTCISQPQSARNSEKNKLGLSCAKLS